MQYPDLQGRLLLFRRCFITKPINLFRTISRFVWMILLISLLQKSLLASIVGCSLQGIEPVYTRCCFAISNGGLGINNLQIFPMLLTLNPFLVFLLLTLDYNFVLQSFFVLLVLLILRHGILRKESKLAPFWKLSNTSSPTNHYLFLLTMFWAFEILKRKAPLNANYLQC